MPRRQTPRRIIVACQQSIPSLPEAAHSARTGYLQLLTWLFTLFNSVRVLAYLPTIWAIFVSGDASQHSLLTWLTWAGANATMAAWLYEHNGQRMDRAIAVNVCNTVMCLLTAGLIVAFRL
jgi:hypothetical protein